MYPICLKYWRKTKGEPARAPAGSSSATPPLCAAIVATASAPTRRASSPWVAVPVLDQCKAVHALLLGVRLDRCSSSSMGRSSATSRLLPLLVGLLSASLVPSCAASLPIMTSSTQWSLHLPLPADHDSGVVTGAESLAFDGKAQGPYTGVSDGRVLRWGGGAVGWRFPMCSTACVAPSQEMEGLCGCPLGLAFHRGPGHLYVADAYLGLMRIGPDGGDAKVLATEAGGVPFHFLNGVDVDQVTGDVYFTDSSLPYPRRFNNEIIFNADATGRLLKYDA